MTVVEALLSFFKVFRGKIWKYREDQVSLLSSHLNSRLGRSRCCSAKSDMEKLEVLYTIFAGYGIRHYAVIELIIVSEKQLRNTLLKEGLMRQQVSFQLIIHS